VAESFFILLLALLLVHHDVSYGELFFIDKILKKDYNYK